MLAEHSNVLNKLSIVLGSQSPRRREILQVNLGLKCAIQPSDFQVMLVNKVIVKIWI